MKKILSIDEAIKELRKHKRNFIQTFDLIINLKNIDLRKPENRINKEVILPYPPKEMKIGVIADNGEITKSDLEGDIKSLKKKLKEFDILVAQPQYMVLVGKVAGKILAPKGKMPKPLPPGDSGKNMIETLKKSIKIRVRNNPTIQCAIGKENMNDKEIKQNIEKVIEFVENTLPKGKAQIKNIYLKLTMSPPVRIR